MTRTVLLINILLLFFSLFAFNSAISASKNKYLSADIKTNYQNSTLIIKNNSNEVMHLPNSTLQFFYDGKIAAINCVDKVNCETQIKVKDYSGKPHNAGNLYEVKLTKINKDALLPGQSMQLNFNTESKDSPHGIKLLTMARVPVQVKVTVSPPNWTQTIQICNNSSSAIPLTDVEFDFNYSTPLNSSIWGSPWVGWTLASQQGSQVILTGGTPWTPALQPDPNCTSPMTIQFNSTPTSPAPVGPFVFKAAGGAPAGFGSLKITLPTPPASNLPNPEVTVQGMGTTAKQVVAWGQVWQVPNLVPGNYTITSAAVNNGQAFYTANSMTATVQDNKVTPVNIAYSSVATGQVTVTLVNAPKAQEPITLTGASYSFNKTVSSGTKLVLPVDRYTITSLEPGYTAQATPNPLNVPSATALSITYQQQNATARFVGYFQTWSTSWTTDGTKTSLANMPSYVNVINLSFMQPDATYVQGSYSFSGTGLQFNYESGAVLRQAVSTLHAKQPGTKVLVAVGGASYTNWTALNPKAIADFVKDFGLDGVDIDYEPASAGCALGSDNLVHCRIDAELQSYVEALRNLLPRPYWITMAGWSIGAYGQDQWTNAQPIGEFTGIMLPLLRSPAAKDIDMINVMSYDASNVYDPKQALAAYSRYYPGPISMGVEVPPEAWGGHVYTLDQVNQLAQAVLASSPQHNTPPGMMIWSLQKQPNGTPSTTNPSAQMMATTICNALGLSNCNVAIPPN